MTTTIPEILHMPDKTLVVEVQGTITAVYERRDNPTATAKSVQNAELQDSAGNKIRLSAWDHPDLTPLKGKEVMLHSNRNRSGQLKGVAVRAGTFKGKPTVELTVGRDGTFQLIEVYKARTPEASEPPLESPRNEDKGSTHTDVPIQAPSGLKRSETALARISALYLMCFERVAFVIEPAVQGMTGQPMTPEQFQSAVSCLYIQANKDNVVPEATYKPRLKAEAPF